MISSTFLDLQQHRTALIKVLNGQELMPDAMENDTARLVNVLDASLQKVRNASAYVLIIGPSYGQIPTERNPKQVSLTELEFDEAMRLGRPILLFIMDENHPVLARDVERDEQKQAKLRAFQERAKRASLASDLHRVYATFTSVEDFARQATQAVAELRRSLDKVASPESAPVDIELIPRPPAFYAAPPYIGSHAFVGRRDQLEALDAWAAPADPHPLLLFEAIGGTGKSMLTWHWATQRSAAVRDWAGHFWYSFYEGGATMALFCQRALAYMTGWPLESLRDKKTAELAPLLLAQLRARPWLLILDGLERILVSYHRFDAAQLADEQAGTTDSLTRLHPCAAIRPEDDNLLWHLVAAAPSKLLLTSRLMPRRLLNHVGQPLPGVRRVVLPGLRPADAEDLFCSCEVHGNSASIQEYLHRQCDCHPLIVGVLAGLVRNYVPNRGSFDEWVGSPQGGARLNLADLDLSQRRNHILHVALEDLSPQSRQLLAALALLSEAVDYDTLDELTLRLPPAPPSLAAPARPEDILPLTWHLLSAERQALWRERCAQELRLHSTYEAAKPVWQQQVYLLRQAQADTLADLGHRGLLQDDPATRRYDLHPVVRSIAAGRLPASERTHYGQRMVDYFAQQTHRPYEEAETMNDVSSGLHVVQALLQMGRLPQAASAYLGPLAQALHFNLEAYQEIILLLKPFFLQGWDSLPGGLDEDDTNSLCRWASFALHQTGEVKMALAIKEATLGRSTQAKNYVGVVIDLLNTGGSLHSQDQLARAARCYQQCLALARQSDRRSLVFCALLASFGFLVDVGQLEEAQKAWLELDPMGRSWPRSMYRAGEAELAYATLCFLRGDLTIAQLDEAQQIALAGRSRCVLRSLLELRGTWYLRREEWELAVESLQEAVRLAREVKSAGTTTEARLALAQFHLRQLPDPSLEAERLSQAGGGHLALAQLWLALDESEPASRHALLAYQQAWANGPPYARAYELEQASMLLQRVGVALPDLPPYNQDQDEKQPWESMVEMLHWRLTRPGNSVSF